MRIYVPSTLTRIRRDESVEATVVHAVTPGLARALPEEDDEGLEYAAFLASADASVSLLATDLAAPRRRVVVVAELAAEAAIPAPGGLPSLVVTNRTIRWRDVVSVHVDDAEAEADVTAAALGDAEALDRSADRDLLWYDATELDVVRAL